MVEARIKELRKNKAIVLWDDLPGNKRPDIIYYLNGKVIGEDVKLSGKNEFDFTYDLEESVQCVCGHHRTLHTDAWCKLCPKGLRFHNFIPSPCDNST